MWWMSILLRSRWLSRETPRGDPSLCRSRTVAECLCGRVAWETGVEQIPAGQVAIHQGDEVEAADGSPVGQVTRLRADPRRGQITHIALREGRPWGRRDVLIPVSAVKRIHKGRIRLSLVQETVAGMLATPAVWRAGDAELKLVTSTFEGEEGARSALEAVAAATRTWHFHPVGV